MGIRPYKINAHKLGHLYEFIRPTIILGSELFFHSDGIKHDRGYSETCEMWSYEKDLIIMQFGRRRQ